VIVVDDDASIRRALKTQLQSLGFTALLFQSAEELLAGNLPADNVCLLVDVYMPGVSGIELCRSLAASGRHLPVILMSGRDDERTRRMMREAQSIARLFKPFDERRLLRVIRKALRDASRAPN
jgi:FixJ family two-component response regulator